MGYGYSKPAVRARLPGKVQGPEQLDEDDSAYEIKSWSSSDDEAGPGASGRPHRESLIIFDWDDTLLCTTAISTRAFIEGQLEQLELAVEAVLHLALALGDTIIVTNGKPSWVKESCRNFFPNLLPTIEQLTVISARARFEHLFPNDPCAWKRQTFRKILQCRRRQVPDDFGLNLVVVGDSMAEIEAAHTATQAVCACRALVKTVKLRPAPSCAQLVGQLRKVMNEFERIVYEARSCSRLLVPRDLSPSAGRTSSEACAWRFLTNKAAGQPGAGHCWSKVIGPPMAGGEPPSEDLPAKAFEEEGSSRAPLGRVPVRVMI